MNGKYSLLLWILHVDWVEDFDNLLKDCEEAYNHFICLGWVAFLDSVVPDKTLLHVVWLFLLEGKSILLVGGAVSVDRGFRTEGKSWWSNETFNLKLEDHFPYKDRQYDLVVTHTRPGVCGAFKGFDKIQHWCDQDYDLKNDLIEESQLVDYLYERTKPKDWIYGHIHSSNFMTYENTAFRCHNIDEHYGYYYEEK